MGTFKKGSIVKVKVEREGFGDFPARCFSLWRPLTEEDVRAWEASDASKGMNDAGETKLPPNYIYRPGTKPTEVFLIVGARVIAPRLHGNPVPGCALVEDEAGERWYVRRKDLH